MYDTEYVNRLDRIIVDQENEKDKLIINITYFRCFKNIFFD